MFEYFPGNYVWNLSVVAALNSGGLIDEVDRACRPIREAAAQGDDAGTVDLFNGWSAVVDTVVMGAAADEKAGRARSAGQKLARAANYLIQAERMQSRHWPGRIAVYERVLELLQRSFDLVDPQTTRVLVPYLDTTLPAYFLAAHRPDGPPAPCIIQWNGLDSTKEHMYLSGFPQELAARGISTLMVDCPGSGEALRLQGLTARVDTEVWAAACLDYLEGRSDVSAEIGLVGWSLGGYFAPRAAAYEKRVKLCVAWGANHNWGEVQQRRRLREGENPVPHYWDHVMWVWGQEDLDSFLDLSAQVDLDGVVERITAPFLITHGENDRQIPVAYAHRSYAQAVNSAKRELRIFTAAEGGAEHISLDHLSLASSFIADWIDETFEESRDPMR